MLRLVDFVLVIPFLVGCAASQPTPESTRADAPGSAAVPTRTPGPLTVNGAPPTGTATPDPCTGWWCTITGIVHADAPVSGNELAGASVTLFQSSYCSPTRGQQHTSSGADGRFEFGEVFFHDTDRIRIQVAHEGYEPIRWDSRESYCLYCNCFALPVEAVLQPAPRQHSFTSIQ